SGAAPLRDDDGAAEGSERERGAAVAERRADRSIADAAAPRVAVAVAADRQRQLRADAAAERARGQLESRRVRQREPYRARVNVDVVDAAARDRAAVFEPAADRLRVQPIAGDVVDEYVAAHRAELQRAGLHVPRADRAADAADREVALRRDARQRDIARDGLRQFDFRRVGRRHVAADGLGPDAAADGRHLDVPGNGFHVDRGAVRHGQRVVDRGVGVPVEPPAVVLGAHVDTSRTLVDDDAGGRELGLFAAPALDRFDGHLVARSGGDDNVARDVLHADTAVAADPHLAREALGLFRPAV